MIGVTVTIKLMAGDDPILVVDDLADAADTLAQLLSLWGYDAEPHYNGDSALRSARRHRPAAAIVDIMMPRMSGFALAEQLHDLPGCSDVPIIAVTGWTGPSCHDRAQSAGIEHYLLKPTDPLLLRDLLKDVVRGCPSGHRLDFRLAASFSPVSLFQP